MMGEAEEEFSLADLAVKALPQQQLEIGLVIDRQNLGRGHNCKISHCQAPTKKVHHRDTENTVKNNFHTTRRRIRPLRGRC
jgi:hypothetical protein